MTLKIECSRYQLFPKARMGAHVVNSQNRVRTGALLRVTFPDGKMGYADCFPWPELGDLGLEAQLQRLQRGTWTELTWGSLICAQVDAIARAEGKSLLDGVRVPQSHFLMTDVGLLTPSQISSVAALGFRQIKVKIGAEPQKEAQQILECASILKECSILLRLDCNGYLSASQFHSFLAALSSMLEQLDWIEDPTPYDPELWTALQKKWKIRLALDRIPQTTWGDLKKDSFAIWVVKPAFQDWTRILPIAKELEVSLTVTSSLGHPIEQLYSAWVAAQMNLQHSLETCGLLSHVAYEPNIFSKTFREEKGVLIPPKGLGFGWDAEWSALPWELLSDSIGIVVADLLR